MLQVKGKEIVTKNPQLFITIISNCHKKTQLFITII